MTSHHLGRGWTSADHAGTVTGGESDGPAVPESERTAGPETPWAPGPQSERVAGAESQWAPGPEDRWLPGPASQWSSDVGDEQTATQERPATYEGSTTHEEPAAHGEPATDEEPATPWSAPAAGRPSWVRRRPFWGGLLTFLGGAEILVTVQVPLPIAMHFGMLGLAGLLVPVIVILCGVLLWINPAQHVFYAIITALMILISWVTSNLGGFFLGLLLGLVGAGLAFAWVPPPARPDPGQTT